MLIGLQAYGTFFSNAYHLCNFTLLALSSILESQNLSVGESKDVYCFYIQQMQFECWAKINMLLQQLINHVTRKWLAWFSDGAWVLKRYSFGKITFSKNLARGAKVDSRQMCWT